ncbi:hypothetical protein F5Y04DRAFT_269619 [Hypomontagnella monticulosa]|nr:hypothetical protein F5Y04DRAFT_269619 [Hypomontagnella monticulosa]
MAQDRGSIPDEDSDEFQKLIKRNFGQSNSQQKPFHPKDGHCKTWKNAPNQKTYSSFGDQGTTASVNMYGEIVQFGTYLGAGDAGMFSADQKFLPEPYDVMARADIFDRYSRTRLAGPGCYGFEFQDVSFEEPPSMAYLHYRWPRYEYRSTRKILTIQWAVHDGIVLQQCVLTNLDDSEMQVSCRFRNDHGAMLIRDLDYIDPAHKFNNGDEEGGDYHTNLGPYGYSWNLTHDPRCHKAETQTNGSFKGEADSSTLASHGSFDSKDELESAMVVVSVFLNGEALRWTSSSGCNWTKRLGGRNSRNSTIEVVTAYRMTLLKTSTASWRDYMIPVESTDIDRILQETPFSPIYISTTECSAQQSNEKHEPHGMSEGSDSDPSGIPADDSSSRSHIEFIVRRNLEHILSVCSIPLKPSGWGNGKATSLKLSSDLYPVALTCGDMSCHRICTSASFFAFRFLVDVSRRLKQLKQSNPEDRYINSLLDRIGVVCRGHLTWLFSNAERYFCEKKEGGLGYFVANYWVTGKAIALDSPTWRPDNSLTDTAYQILKAGEWVQFSNDREDLDLARDAVGYAYEPWMKSLERLDRRGCFAWPHAQQGGTNVFRLSDHVLIWKALTTVEEFDLWPIDTEGGRLMSPSQIQQGMLRRFITENEASRKRMLAVTRSSRETRFMFHARDTTLFYGCDWGFFLQQTPFREAWKDTLEAQAFYTDNQDTLWNNTLRYALGIMMGIRGHAVNQQSGCDLVKMCLRAILQATSSNGFCSVKLQDITKEPVLFSREDDRDYYFHASFEIPYILLVDAARIHRIYGQKPDIFQNDQSYQSNQQVDHVLGDADGYYPKMRKPQLKRQTLNEKIASEPSSLRKTVPFGRRFDSANVFNIEEEWLYNYPSFLLSETAMTSDDIKKAIITLATKDRSLEANEPVVVRAAKGVRQSFGDWSVGGDEYEKWDKMWFENWLEDDQVKRSLVSDIPKTMRLEKRDRPDVAPSAGAPTDIFHRFCNKSLLHKLMGVRNATNAKKRFVWLTNADINTALICYLGSVETERPAISLFFDRHWHHDGYFFDDTTMVMNTWETELHLGFYSLLDAQEISFRGASASHNDIILDSRRISKVSMGFRLWGDLFDRHWTCHFIEDINVLSSNLHKQSGGDSFYWEPSYPHTEKGKYWRQRKVVELYLFGHILAGLVQSTREIFESVKKELGVQQGHGLSFPAIPSSEDYFFSSAQWRKFQDLLQAIDENLEEVKLEVSKWVSREKDRGQEKPRWTRDHERKYGAIIKKLQVSAENQIRSLHGVHSSVKSLEETLIRRMEQIREDIALRGSEDIRFFTYVTVVFLPLGFASGIFSMNGTPEPDLLNSLVICAIVSLVVTIFALFNAKTLSTILRRRLHLIDSYSQEKMEQSFLIPRHERTAGRARKSTIDQRQREPESGGMVPEGPHEDLPRSHPFDGTETKHAPRVWFLVSYAVLELPVRRVAVAYDALRNPKLTWISCLHVILGFLCLPLCVLFWFLRFAIANMVDLLQVILIIVSWPFLLPPPDEVRFGGYMRELATLFDTMRPLKYLGSRIDKRREVLKGR